MKNVKANNQHAALMFVLVASCLLPSATLAEVHVSQCVATDGSSIYTDASCRLIGAKAVPMPSRLVKSLVRESTLSGNAPAAAVATDTVAAAAAATTKPQPRTAGRSALHRVETDQCPKTPGQLAAALRTSLSGGDVNELAAVYDWNGMTDKQARLILQRLEKMSDRPLIDGHFFDAGTGGLASWSAQSPAASEAADDGFVQLVQGSGVAPTVTELAVKRRAGCLLLRF